MEVAGVATKAEALLAELNPAQRAAVEALRGPVCILAGAGSGKTRTITHRIAYQVLSGVAEPGQILAVTFTDRAARELRARLRALGLPRPVRAATFHAAAWAQLRYFWPQVEPGPLPEVLGSKLPLLTPVARRLNAQARDLATEIEWAKARALDPDGYLDALGGRRPPVPPERMARVYAGYERAKAERNLIDYEDMLLRTHALLTAHPDVAATVRDRYRCFTVDEFQDVNPAQWALLRTWLGPSDELCVVGDDDQAIYSFTGASARYLIDFERHFPGAQRVSLVDNYRSTREVLTVAASILKSRKPLRAQTSGGPAPELRAFASADEELDAVVQRVSALIDEGVPPREIAICYRVNSQSEAFETALRGAAIPFAVRGEGGFFARPEIQQALRALAGAAERGRADAVPAVAGARRARPVPADRQAEQVLREQLAWHPRREPDGEAARERWRNLGALLDVVRRMAAEQPEITLAAVVAELRSRAAAGEVTADDGGAVNLLTLHRAKGLEFDAVFLVALEEGLLPISHAVTEDEVAEERRLLYVGVTRARRWLWMSWARQRATWAGRVSRRRPSRFLPRERTPRHGSARSATGQLPLADRALAERLRAWRLERARADGVPAYVVFADRTLEELAATCPRDLDALRAVHGLGSAKVQRYGEELLGLLNGGS